MPRFFVQKNISIEETTIEIQNEDSRHIRDVLRMKLGEKITICDSSGVDHDCIISSFDKDIVSAKIIDRKISDNEPPYEITVYQGLPKSDKMESIIQKCVELGVTRIVPVACARSIVKLTDKKDIDKKTDRWNKIAHEAAKQCNRSIIPIIERPITFKDAISQVIKANISFIPWECEDKEGLKNILQNEIATGKNIDNNISYIISKLDQNKSGAASEIELSISEDAGEIKSEKLGDAGETAPTQKGNAGETAPTPKGTAGDSAASEIELSISEDAGEMKSKKLGDAVEINPIPKGTVGDSAASGVIKPKISFVVGPEGGFDQNEIQYARQQGIKTVTLGKRILRTETAAPAILSMILYETEL